MSNTVCNFSINTALWSVNAWIVCICLWSKIGFDWNRYVITYIYLHIIYVNYIVLSDWNFWKLPILELRNGLFRKISLLSKNQSPNLAVLNKQKVDSIVNGTTITQFWYCQRKTHDLNYSNHRLNTLAVVCMKSVCDTSN